MSPLYYESHVTVEPAFGELHNALRGVCERHGFRVADLLMQKRRADTPERSMFDSFCSSRDEDGEALELRMLDLVKDCWAAGIRVWRYKIEAVVIDSDKDDELMRLDRSRAPMTWQDKVIDRPGRR